MEEKDIALFDFLEERRKLNGDKDKPNWFTIFTNSTDLKAALRKYYDEAFLPQHLTEAIYKNALPFFAVEVTLQELRGLQFAKVIATNAGASTALNTRMYFGTFKTQMDTLTYFVAPSNAIDKLLPIDDDTSSGRKQLVEPLFIEYDTMLGVRVIQEYAIETCFIGDDFAIIVNASPKSRRFLKAKPELPVIEEAAP